MRRGPEGEVVMTTGPAPEIDRPTEPQEAARVEKDARSLENGGRGRWRVFGRASRDSSTDESVQPEPEPGSGPVTFSDLVRAHRVWELELDKVERRKLESCQESEQLFRLRLRQFEARYGRIDSAYWSVRDASAVALTLERRPLRWRPDTRRSLGSIGRPTGLRGTSRKSPRPSTIARRSQYGSKRSCVVPAS